MINMQQLANMVTARQCIHRMTLGRNGEKLVVHQITVKSTDNAHSLILYSMIVR